MNVALPKLKPSSWQVSSLLVKTNRTHVFWSILLLLGVTSTHLLFRARTFESNDVYIVEDDDPVSTEAFLDDVKLSLSSSLSAFDQIQLKTYERAVNTATTTTTTRKALSLEGWERGSGGLVDSDRLLLGDLYLNANSVFEFGLGESTLIAAAVNVPRYAGVDSDAVWVSMAREQSHMDHFRFYFADIGPTAGWGTPTNRKQRKIAYNYQVSSLAAELKPFDVYLVDGRYRVACACLSFLHAMKLGADMTQVQVGVHDSHVEERGYEVLADIATVTRKSQRLYVYKLKATTKEQDVLQLWMNYFNIIIR